MADRLSKEKRSALMARVGQKNTRPETVLRKALFAAGLRFRLHDKRLPGRPDIVLPGRHHAIFVHGCYWHRPEGCKRASMPKTNVAFWEAKFEANVKRDRGKIIGPHF